MTSMGKHEPDGAAVQRRDHLWVAVIIAACALLEVWASWIAIGSMSGFPRIGGAHGISTDWTLAVTMESYWAYALYAWLAAAPGPRSRAFAKWSAIAVFVLSLTGQGAAHLVKPGTAPPPALVVFITALPVLVLALIAILVHLRQEDRKDAGVVARTAAAAERQAAIERAEADERTWLRRELDALSAQRDADVSALGARLDEAVSALASAQREAAEALRRAEVLDRKLAAVSDHKPPRPRKAAAEGTRASAQPAAGDGDLTTELLAYMALSDDPELRKPRKGGDLARKVGVSGATARRYREKFLNPDGSLRKLPAESLTGSLTERSG
jgi:hypothetical protein